MGSPADLITYSPAAAQHNLALINYCRISIAALSGCTAGILGLTGIMGFMFYFLAHGFLSLLLLQKAGKLWNKYFIQRSCLTYGGVFGELTTYILFWTFIYGMVHVY
ncbi:unnamed protein product [Schistosoma rodhaini]|uniref:ER membrane protein complex subunit 6 n=1 Tax=Schistosoma rodhaini TaxID=6188 RepID=A0A183RTR7_9TREM|nr:unnamed protein product [Schistosoma rodhaini]